MGEVMNIDKIIADWNEQADHMNKWDSLGEDEKLEWAMKLEREECIKLVHAGTGEPVQTRTLLILQKDRKRIEDAIRARGTT